MSLSTRIVSILFQNHRLRVSKPLLDPPIELSNPLALLASLIQFKCPKYFRDDLTLVFEDAQCFYSISEPLLLLLLKLYLFTLTPSAIADFQGGRDNKKKTIYINTNKDSKTQVRC